eukprot:s102_g22.t2
MRGNIWQHTSSNSAAEINFFGLKLIATSRSGLARVATMERPGLPVCIITGFLGTGKTTLLNHILQNQRGARVAVFVNEFGSVDIDGDLIKWQGKIDEARVITLDNGCMCCEVNDDLQKQLRRVLEAQKQSTETLDLLVIETSGLCDPAPVLSTLEQLDDLAVSVHLDTVVTVVDASDLEGSAMPKSAEVLCLQETAAQQIKYCDLVLLNKCDLLGGLHSQRVLQLEEHLADILSKCQKCVAGGWVNLDQDLCSGSALKAQSANGMPSVWLIFLAVTLRVHGHSRLCLPDAIPEIERQNVVVDGISMPIGIWSSSWDSALIVSSIYQILVQEKLGYNSSISIGNISKIQLWKVAGCEHDPVSNNITGGPGTSRHHVTFEFWHGADAELPTWLLELGDFAPENLGSIGYSGTEGMHIMRPPVTAALADSGLPLEYFRSYNRSWYNPSMYTATVAQVDLAKLRTCAESVEMRWKDIGDIYLAATGDVDGLEDKDGKKVLKCWQEKWWAAPACRQSIPDCASVITTKDALGLPYMIQQAFFHNMPLAFAMASENFYVALNLELQGLLYWWAPDTQFALQKPHQLMFPPHSPSQYKQQIYKTMKEKTLLSNWMAKGFRDIAERPAAVASKLQLGDEDIKALLVAQVEAGNQDPWDTACDWLLQSDHLWQDWLPNETTCSMGKGLVDSSDNFTLRRGMAVKCAPCRPGHQSVEQDRTRVCIPCDPGHYQPLPAKSTCLPCEPGTRSALKGQTECVPCGLGRFANRSAMTSCVQCGPADQTERWTTSEAVMSQREQTWIQIQGADSEDNCSCVEGTYLWKGRCEVCIEGSICPGSNQLLLKPGYFSKPEAPGDVFRCYGRSRRCPGGVPGSCAAGRDINSLSCTSCLPGLHETEDLCIACVSEDYVMVVLVGILCVFGIAILYVVLVKEGKTSRQPGSLLIAALGLGQMVTVVQQLTVIQQFKIAWGQPFSSILEFLELLAFDLDMVSIGCVAPMSPVLQFSIRTLLVLLFFVVACMVHCVYIAYKRAKTFRITLLLRTVGTLFMVFFISLCSSLLAPFRCHIHPNGLWTVQSYDEVFCDGTQELLQMALVGGFACLLPVSFLVLSVWIILYQLPKRLENADVQFIRACSFLFVRFRPGAEVFSVLFLARNTLVVLCPLLPSSAGKVVCMNILLSGSLVITAFYKPWRAPACNFLDLLLVTGMLVILDMGSLFVTEVDTRSVTTT